MAHITLTPDEMNTLQAKLDQPMTIEDAEDILQEFGFIDCSLDKDPANPYRVYLQLGRTEVTTCENEQGVLDLAQKALDEEVA
jgi:hypothetical protein